MPFTWIVVLLAFADTVNIVDNVLHFTASLSVLLIEVERIFHGGIFTINAVTIRVLGKYLLKIEKDGQLR